MSYTVSHRQAGVQRASAGGLIRHTFRDVDKTNGIETQHSNERIIPERTHLNESVLFVDGEEVQLTNSQQILDELDSRLEKAGGTRTNKKTGKVSKIAVREDAKVVRDLVLQLDPKFTRSCEYLLTEDGEEKLEEVRELLNEMVEHYAEVYGRKNLLAASLHLDETSPHIHLLVTPIDEEGRVRQESFIESGRGSKSGLAKNDQAMRERLAAADYDVDKKPRGGNRSNMSVDEYAKYAQRIEDLEAREIEVEDRHWIQKSQDKHLNGRMAKLDVQRDAQKAQEVALSARESLAQSQAAKNALDAQKLARERRAVAKEAETAKIAFTFADDYWTRYKNAGQELRGLIDEVGELAKSIELKAAKVVKREPFVKKSPRARYTPSVPIARSTETDDFEMG